MWEHQGPVAAGLTGACSTETGSMWPCPQASSLGCCHLPVLLLPAMLCLPVTPWPACGSWRHMAKPRGWFPASSSSACSQGHGARALPALKPEPWFPCLLFLHSVGFYTKVRHEGHVPSEESTGCGISGEGGRTSEAAGGKIPPRHGADGAGRQAGVSPALLRGVSQGFAWIRCARCCNLTWRAPGRGSAPATLACARDLMGFCKRWLGTASPRQARELQRRRRVQGDSAREPLSQLSQALFQRLRALLRGGEYIYRLPESPQSGFPQRCCPFVVPPQARHPGQSRLLPMAASSLQCRCAQTAVSCQPGGLRRPDK